MPYNCLTIPLVDLLHALNAESYMPLIFWLIYHDLTAMTPKENDGNRTGRIIS